MSTTLMLDVDTGIDDALALMSVLADPRADIAAIASTAGNVPAARVAANNLALLDLCQAPDIEVALGAQQPLATPLRTTEDTHGPQGIGYAELLPSARVLSERTAAQLWVDTVRTRPGEVVGLATGPLTNLALALRLEPQLPHLLRRLVIMGGAFNHPGNTTPTNEWNVHVDPEAAKEVFDAFSLVPADRRPIVCALDITETIEMNPDHLRRIAERANCAGLTIPAPGDRPGIRCEAANPMVRFLFDAVRFYFEFHDRFGLGYIAHMHDPFAAAVALDSAIAELRPATVDVELTGTLTRAQTVADWAGMWGREPNADIAVRTDPGAFFDQLIARLGDFAVHCYPAPQEVR